jgi:hypothetical protein
MAQQNGSAENRRVAAARAAQTVGYLERGKYSPTS